MRARFADAKAIFFDVDNTLYDFEESMRVSFVQLHNAFPEVLDAHGHDKLAEAYWSFYRGMPELAKRELINRDPDLFRRTMWAGALKNLGFADDFCAPDGFARELTNEHMRWRPQHWRDAMYAGARETIDALAKVGAQKLGVITNGPSPVQRPKVEALNHGWFEEPLVFVSGEFGVYKPDPSIFLAAAKAAGVEPRECVMIGDAREYDMPAKAVGFRTILFDGKSEAPDCSADPYPPDAVVRGYAELRALLLDEL